MFIRYELLRKPAAAAGFKKRWLSFTTEKLREKTDKTRYDESQVPLPFRLSDCERGQRRRGI